MSVRMIWTSPGWQPSARQVPSVSSLASLRRCSVVRPSNIWTLIIGMALSSWFLGSHRDVARLGGDAAEPAGDMRVVVKQKAAFLRDVRVAIERDVGDAVAVGDEEPVVREVLLHYAQRGIATLHA